MDSTDVKKLRGNSKPAAPNKTYFKGVELNFFKARLQSADIAGGGINAVIGILLALYAREKTGKGQYIDISMTDGMVGFLSPHLYHYQLTGQHPTRADYFLSHRYDCYNTYETKDGRYISIGAVENRFWKTLCERLKKRTAKLTNLYHSPKSFPANGCIAPKLAWPGLLFCVDIAKIPHIEAGNTRQSHIDKPIA